MFSRFAPARWVAGCSDRRHAFRPALRAPPCATRGAPKSGRTTTLRSSSTPARFSSIPTTSMREPALQRARLRASQDHFTRARRFAANGRLDEAVAEYKLAAELNPDNADHRRGARAGAESAAHASGGQSRRQDRARGARGSHERSAPARPRRAGRSVARGAQLPQRRPMT